MENLWERLDENIKTAIEKDAEKYPEFVKSLKNELMTNVVRGDIKLSSCEWLMKYRSGSPFDDFSVYEFYKLFSNETERYEVINEVSDLICPILSKIQELYEIDWFQIIRDTIEIETENSTYVLIMECVVEDCRISEITFSSKSYIQFDDGVGNIDGILRQIESEMKGLYL